MDGSAWANWALYCVQVPGRSMERRGILVTVSTRRRVLKPAMLNRRAVLRWRDTYTSVAHDFRIL